MKGGCEGERTRLERREGVKERGRDLRGGRGRTEEGV
jgi:hypothetical protein